MKNKIFKRYYLNNDFKVISINYWGVGVTSEGDLEDGIFTSPANVTGTKHVRDCLYSGYKNIWEGDYVKYPKTEGFPYNRIGEVKFTSGAFYFSGICSEESYKKRKELPEPNMSGAYLCNIRSPWLCEVLGNKYEHPNLKMGLIENKIY